MYIWEKYVHPVPFEPWWIVSIKGVLAILFGLVALLRPDITLITLATIFGIMAIAGGIFLLGGTFSKKSAGSGRPIWVVEGLIDLLIGCLLLFYPTATISLFFILLAMWAIFMGVIYLMGALKFREILPGWQVTLAGGIISVILGLVLAVKPFGSAVFLTYLAGGLTLLVGFVVLLYSLRLRQLSKGV